MKTKRAGLGQTCILCAFGLIPVLWAALLVAPFISGGLIEIVQNLTEALNNPTMITLCEDSVKTVLIFIAAYVIGIGIRDIPIHPAQYPNQRGTRLS